MHITLEPYLPTLFALYLVAVALPRGRSAVAMSVGAVTASAAIVISEPWPDDLGLALTVCLLMVTTWALGWTTRLRRSFVDRTNADRAEKALAQERLRIARELHDIVAHSLTVIAVKAGIAHHLADSQPGEAKEALGVIETTSRETLTEMRHLLGVLRSEEAEPEMAPVPGLDDLPGLVDRAAMAGVRVTLDVTGTVPDGVGLTVYRIVQEAVTNVVKHAAPARCRVVVAVSDDVARIEVTDDGAGERVLAGGGGHGLVGMRERVTMYGGSLTAGPRAAGGFQVVAEVPFA
jgi:signal transduction histidine kinase